MNQFSPRPSVSHKGRSELFRKSAEKFAAQGSPPVKLTPVANGKKSAIRKTLTPLGSRVNKFEMTLMLFSGAWGKMIHFKNLKQKIS
jgi:hypothetical protein